MRGLSGVFQVAFDTSTSGVVMSLDFLIPLDVLPFTVAKIWPRLFDRWVCVKAVLAACMSCVAAERETGDACGILLAAPQVVFVCRHPLLALQPPVTLCIQCSDKKTVRFCQRDGLELTSNTPVWYNKSFLSCEALNGSGLLKSPAFYAAGWQRGCTAIGDALCAYRALQSHTWQMADSFVERWAGCGILRGRAALLKDCRITTSTQFTASAPA